jgi:FkbM family methyltransferase
MLELPKMNVKSSLRRLAPRTIRPHRILGGQLRGRIIVTSFHDYPAAILGRTEPGLLTWFTKNVAPGETWLDVGAHYGYTTIALAESVERGGHVYAFEPSVATAGHLSRTCVLNHLNQVTVVPFGLGQPGDIRMISVPMDRGMANHAFGGTDTEDIFVVGFDHLWDALGQPALHGVKIDVQGMESQVLEGMTGALTEQHPKVVIEFHAGVDRSRILSLLDSLDYRLPAAAIEPLSGETHAAYHDNQSYAFQASD